MREGIRAFSLKNDTFESFDVDVSSLCTTAIEMHFILLTDFLSDNVSILAPFRELSRSDGRLAGRVGDESAKEHQRHPDGTSGQWTEPRKPDELGMDWGKHMHFT